MKNFIVSLLSNSVSVEIIIAVVTIISSLLITKWTISSERRKMVSELQRTAYMTMLTLITKIRDNPTLVFYGETIDQLKTAFVAIDVYGKDSIKKSTASFVKTAEQKYHQFVEKFDVGDKNSFREQMKKSWTFAEMLDREEENYMIHHLPSTTEIEQLAESLKKEITVCLRKG
jgi:hypothetical protein